MCWINDKSNCSWDWNGSVYEDDLWHILSDDAGDKRTWPMDTVLKCTDCEQSSPAAAWRNGFVDCEDCGDHSAILCPWCGYRHDGIFGIPKVVN